MVSICVSQGKVDYSQSLYKVHIEPKINLFSTIQKRKSYHQMELIPKQSPNAHSDKIKLYIFLERLRESMKSHGFSNVMNWKIFRYEHILSWD